MLDLDETLIHSTSNKIGRFADFHYGNYYIYARPHLNDFIEKCNQISNLAIWSSAGKEYVHSIVNRIIPSFIELTFIWAKPNFMTADVLKWGRYGAKKLNRLIDNGFDPSKVLIIDDNPDDSVCEFGNTLVVQPFRGEPDDYELLLLSAYLENTKYVEDACDIARPSWRDLAIEAIQRKYNKICK